MTSCGATLEIKTEICMINNVCRRVPGCVQTCADVHNLISSAEKRNCQPFIIIKKQSVTQIDFGQCAVNLQVFYYLVSIRIGWTVQLLHFPCSLSPHPPPCFPLTLPVYQTVMLVSVIVCLHAYAKTKTGVLQIIFLMFSILTQFYSVLLCFHISLYGTNVFELSLDGRKCSQLFGKLN